MNPHKLVERRLLREMPGGRLFLVVSVTLSLVSTATVVVQAVALGRLVASAFGSGHGTDRVGLLAWLAGAAALRALCVLGAEVFAGHAASSAKADLRSRLVRATFEHSPSTGSADAADVAVVAGKGLDALDVYIGRCVPDLLVAAIVPLALICAVGVLDWLSSLILLCTLVLFPMFGYLVGRASEQIARERWAQVRALGVRLLDIFEGLPLLKAFGRSADERDDLIRASEELRTLSLAGLRAAFLSALVLDTLASVSVALVAVPLGLRLLNGSVGLAPALAVLVITPEVFLPVRRASAEFHESSEGLAALSDAYAMIDAAGTAVDPGPYVARSPDPRVVAVRLRSVSYSFRGPTRRPGDRRHGDSAASPVLDGCDLEIEPGETVVVSGSNGVGKSTLLAVLLGFVVPESGAVEVGGQNLRRLEPKSWQAHLAYLPERPALVSATLAQNLRIANPGASDRELLEVLRGVGGDDILRSLPRGLETPIGEGGIPLSAGERQRVGLARILLSRASMYVLDEPTVHLDPPSAEKVVDALRSRLDGASAILVTHHSAPMVLGDRILELREGRLEAIDTPAMSSVS